MSILGEGESGNVYSAFCSPSSASASIRNEMVNSKISGGVDSRVAVKVIRMPSEADAEATARISGLKKEMKFWEQCSLSVSPSRAQLYVKVELAADALSLSFHLCFGFII